MKLGGGCPDIIFEQLEHRSRSKIGISSANHSMPDSKLKQNTHGKLALLPPPDVRTSYTNIAEILNRTSFERSVNVPLSQLVLFFGIQSHMVQT